MALTIKKDGNTWLKKEGAPDDGALHLVKGGGVGQDDDCCCGVKCCVIDLPDTIHMHITTTATSVIDLEEVYSGRGGRDRVWQGFGGWPVTQNAVYIQIYAICSDVSEEVSWYLCWEQCLDGEFKCDVDPPTDNPDFDPDWETLGNVSYSSQGCFPPEATGISPSDCAPGGPGYEMELKTTS